MTEWWYRRAHYNEEKQAYIVRHEDGSEVQYSFLLLEPDEDEPQPTLALYKQWAEEDIFMGELYSFCTLDQPEDFQQVVAAILANGREASVEENGDELLAVIDVVKHRAIDADFDDEWIEEVEGLFETGPEDAYTRRDYEPERLHHHVARPDDECWRIDVVKVRSAADPAQELGWMCYVIHYPELTSSASAAEIEQAQSARLLDLEHHIDEVGARVGALHLQKFMMEGERVENPEYAYLNDTLVFEFVSVLGREENNYCPEWQILSGKALQIFRESRCHSRQVWYPRDLFRDLAEDMAISPAQADQYAAMWRDLMGIEPEPFKANSPFKDLEL
ncbi:MAG: hypothetical protein KJ064_27455 [Anaerolineae bacterium]|nr:hypothetical protein [Anaerolineae bacterium]